MKNSEQILNLILEKCVDDPFMSTIYNDLLSLQNGIKHDYDIEYERDLFKAILDAAEYRIDIKTLKANGIEFAAAMGNLVKERTIRAISKENKMASLVQSDEYKSVIDELECVLGFIRKDHVSTDNIASKTIRLLNDIEGISK